MKKKLWRASVEAERDRIAARDGFGLAVIAGRREWEAWCARGVNDNVPTQPETEWVALGELQS